MNTDFVPVPAMLLGLVVAFASSAAWSNEVGADMVAITAAAREEGTVVWYANPGFRDTLREPLAKWAEMYPDIEVQVVEATGSQSLERVKAEQAAGSVVADIVTAGDGTFYPVLELFSPMRTEVLPNVANISSSLGDFIDPDKLYIPTDLFVYGIGVNTRRLDEADWPARWSDVISGQYENAIGIHDFGIRGGGNAMVEIGREALGDDFFRALVAQDPRAYGRAQELDAALARGERAISVPSRSRIELEYDGAPIKWIQPEDGVFFVVMQSGVVKNARHPNAAHLFLNFLLGEDAQKAFAAIGDGAVNNRVDSKIDLDTAVFLGRGAISPNAGEAGRAALEFGKNLLNP